MKNSIDERYKDAIKVVENEKSKIANADYKEDLETSIAINFFKENSDFFKHKYKNCASSSRNKLITDELYKLFPYSNTKKISSYLNMKGILTLSKFIILLVLINISFSYILYELVCHSVQNAQTIDIIMIISFAYCYALIPISGLLCALYDCSSYIKLYFTNFSKVRSKL